MSGWIIGTFYNFVYMLPAEKTTFRNKWPEIAGLRVAIAALVRIEFLRPAGSRVGKEVLWGDSGEGSD